MELPTGERYTAGYDGAGRMVWQADPAGNRTIRSYDRRGNVVSVTSPEGLREELVYDSADRVIRRIEPDGAQWQYRYDETGNPVAETDPAGHEYRYVYGSRGELVEEYNRLGHRREYTYDAALRVTAIRDFDGSEQGMHYDEVGRITGVVTDGSLSEEYAYTPRGNLLRAANDEAVTTFSYDERGLMTRSADLSAGVELAWQYDAAGRPTVMSEDVTDSTVRYEYGKMGELQRMESSEGVWIELGYDESLRETDRRFSNGVVRDTIYNDAGRQAGIVHRRLQGIRGGDILEAEAYVYDRDGRRTFTIDETAGITSYTYGDAGRLSTVLYPRDEGVQASQIESLRRLGMTGSLTQPGQMPVRHTDLAGRLRISSTERQAIDDALAATMPRRTGMVNYLQPVWGEAYTYDSSGNRSEWRTPFQSVSYRYDAENRMTEAGNVRYEYTETGGIQREIGTVHELVYSYTADRVSGITGNLPGGEQVEVSYGYDALGRRTSRQDRPNDRAIRTVYEGLSMNSVMTLETDRVFAEGITGAGTNRNTGSAGTGRYRRSDGPGAGLARPASLETRTVRMGRDVVAQMTGGPKGEITFYGHDILGSVTARFSDRGERVEELEYRAFGELRRGELTTEHPYGYTGKAMDPATGIYDYGFRDYAPELARFTTVDPIRDGNNWYAYVANDPVNFVDPLGLLSDKPGDGVAEVPYIPRNPYEDSRLMEERAPVAPLVTPDHGSMVAGGSVFVLGTVIRWAAIVTAPVSDPVSTVGGIMVGNAAMAAGGWMFNEGRQGRRPGFKHKDNPFGDVLKPGLF